MLGHVRPLVGLGSDDAAGGDTREEAAAAWRLLLRAIAEQAPLIVAFEDLHWADEILLDFVETLPRDTVNATMLVLCTARPELLDRRPGWGGGQRNTATLSLAGLADRDAVALLQRLLDGTEPSAELISKAGGNPLYAEEYARLVNEGCGTADLGIPASLETLIAARSTCCQPPRRCCSRTLR